MLNDIVRENIVKDRLADLKMLSLSDVGSYVSDGMFEHKEVLFSCWKVGRKSRRVTPLPRSEEEPGHVVVVTEEKSADSLEDEVNTFIPDERLELSALGKGEILVDLDQYVVLTVWIERDPDYNDPTTNWWIHPEKKHECDYRYYWDKDHISFMRHQQEEGKEEIATDKIADGDVVKGMDTIQDKVAQKRFQEINRDYVVIHQKIGFHGWSTIQEVRRYADNREELWLNKNGRWYDNTPRVPHKDSVPRVIPGTWKDGKYTRDGENQDYES